MLFWCVTYSFAIASRTSIHAGSRGALQYALQVPLHFALQKALHLALQVTLHPALHFVAGFIEVVSRLKNHSIKSAEREHTARLY